MIDKITRAYLMHKVGYSKTEIANILAHSSTYAGYLVRKGYARYNDNPVDVAALRRKARISRETDVLVRREAGGAFKDIGRDLGVSPERVRQIYARAVRFRPV